MEAKIEEFINLKKGNMSVKEYALKTTFFQKNSSFFVSNPRYMMTRFVMGVSN